MVKFAGSEANASNQMASGIWTKKNRFYSYHGWHDWYLAANIKSRDGLNNHLLPGLSPEGVPSELSGSSSLNTMISMH